MAGEGGGRGLEGLEGAQRSGFLPHQTVPLETVLPLESTGHNLHKVERLPAAPGDVLADHVLAAQPLHQQRLHLLHRDAPHPRPPGPPPRRPRARPAQPPPLLSVRRCVCGCVLLLLYGPGVLGPRTWESEALAQGLSQGLGLGPSAWDSEWRFSTGEPSVECQCSVRGEPLAGW